MKKPAKLNPPRIILRNSAVKAVTLFGADGRAIYSFRPETPEELTFIIELTQKERE